MSDLYQRVTDDIIQALETGTPPWIKPWHDADDGLHANLVTRRRYRGINVLLLNLVAQTQGYAFSRWITFQQAQSLGAHVKKGERGTPVVFFKLHEVSDTKDAAAMEPPSKVIPLLRSFTVFNLDQVEGLPERCLPKTSEADWSPLEQAKSLLRDSGASIRHGGNRAVYMPHDDTIQLPPMTHFPCAEGYYGTALHELVHWTGHRSRLARTLGMRHGIDAYAFEELVAEMGAAFLCAHCHLPGQLRHASYIAGWLDALRNDRRLVFQAAAKAQQAADFVLGTTYEAPSPAQEMAA